MHHLFGIFIIASYVCTMKSKIINYISLYSPKGPDIWFLHKNKRIYKLLSNLHPSNAVSNGSNQDGVVAQSYIDGQPQWRSCFIFLSKIKQIWREPDPKDKAIFELQDWDYNENEIPLR